jgi:hypothetical protein
MNAYAFTLPPWNDFKHGAIKRKDSCKRKTTLDGSADIAVPTSLAKAVEKAKWGRRGKEDQENSPSVPGTPGMETMVRGKRNLSDSRLV